MSMYRVVNRESGLIYSVDLGWIKEHGKMYGHCFEKEEALKIANKYSLQGVPVEILKDKVASRFVFMGNLNIPKLLIPTLFGFLALFLSVKMANKITINTNSSQNPLAAISSAAAPIFIPIYITMAVLIGIILFIALVEFSKEKSIKLLKRWRKYQR